MALASVGATLLLLSAMHRVQALVPLRTCDLRVGRRVACAAASAGDSVGARPAAPDIFCNRELSLKGIDAVGFDMDYTLAQYKPEFDLLAYNGALDKLVAMGYPETVRSFCYDPSRFRRGLVLDKQRGNIIKMDRYKYVRVAYHGSRRLCTEERKATYRESVDKQPTYTGKEYVNADTLFHLVDAALFEQMVDLKDELEDENPFLASRSYFQIYTDIRTCVDLCHRDGVIKDRVAEDPERYIIPDPNLFTMLHKLRLAGKKVFLLTNSLFDYTHVVMTFLRGGPDWLDFFDLVISGSCKPAFLQDPYLPLFRVNTAEYSLRNTDGVNGDAEAFLKEGKVFQGGNWNHLHALLELRSGDRLLYVGDHMYSDILRSKRTLGWRTCLVIPELESEMATYRAVQHSEGRALSALRRLQAVVDDEVDALSLQLYQEGLDEDKRLSLGESLADKLQEQEVIKDKVSAASADFHSHFHPKWGQIFKAGFMDSRFAKQVLDYACIYTTRASDLGSVSPAKNFRGASDLMPHDRALETAHEDNPFREGPCARDDEERSNSGAEGGVPLNEDTDSDVFLQSEVPAQG